MLKRNPLSFAIGALAMMSSQALMAQAEIESEMIAAAAEEQVAVEVEEVVVTGSRIQRDVFSSSSPMEIIQIETAMVQGIGDIATLLQTSPVAAGSPQVTSASSTAFVQNGGSGAQTLSLRGLGANRTLVLLNGRRAGPAGVRGGVSSFDFNVLPLSTIARVEILKDGASSIYGSDAVAGVVNIITNKSDGGSFDAFASQPDNSGGEQSRVSFRFGDTVGKLRYSATADYYERTELAKGDRDYFNCGEQYIFNDNSGAPGFGRADVTDPRTGDPQCNDLLWGHVWIYDYTDGVPSRAKAQYDYDGDLGNYIPSFEDFPDMNTPAGWYPVAYDQASDGVTNADHPFQDKASLIPKTELMTFYAEAQYEFSDNMTGYAEVLMNRRKNNINGYRQFWSYTYNSGSDYFPDNMAPTAEGWTGNQWLSSTPITDQNDTTITVDYSRFVAGVMGDFADDWQFDLSYQFSESDAKYSTQQIKDDAMRSNNWLGDTCAGTTLASGVPCQDLPWFDPQFLAGEFTDEQKEYLFAWETGTTMYEQQSVEGFISGPLMELPAGELAVAVGFHYRTDEILDTPGEITRAGNAALMSTAGITKGDDTTKAVFMEVDWPIVEDLPLIKSLTMNASARYTDVDSYGSGDTYKIGLNWELTDTVRVRAGHGTSFRTPALFELYLDNQTSSISQRTVDPCIGWGDKIAEGSISQRLADNCAADGVDPDHYAAISATVITGGGFGVLEAETSVANTAGIVWRPEFADLSVSADYFDIEIDDEVSQLGAGSIVYGCYNSENFPNDPLCDQFERDPVDGKVDNINDSYLNVASQINRGWDLSVRYSTEVKWGELIFDTQHTFQIEDSVALRTESLGTDYNGRMGDPKWTGNASLNLISNDWSYYWGVQIIGPASNHDTFGGDMASYRGTPVRVVLGASRVLYHNLSVTRSFPDQKMVARFGVNNALGTKPPRLTTMNLGQVSTEGNSAFYSQYNWVGRSFFLNLTKSF
jgi:iron complex outermembrane receptor protein